MAIFQKIPGLSQWWQVDFHGPCNATYQSPRYTSKGDLSEEPLDTPGPKKHPANGFPVVGSLKMASSRQRATTLKRPKSTNLFVGSQTFLSEGRVATCFKMTLAN